MPSETAVGSQVETKLQRDPDDADPAELEPGFAGVRMSADEFLRISDDGTNYELVDGVVVMSPNPKPWHQRITSELVFQIGLFLHSSPVGEVFPETDVHLGRGPRGDLVYKPELVFIRAELVPQMLEQIVGGPDLVVEVISETSRRFDTKTKKADYERYGVREYWIIDPRRRVMAFYQLRDGRFVEIIPAPDRYESVCIPGFVLDLEAIRRKF